MSRNEIHTSCITDKPLASFNDDYLEAETYASALFNFIVNADTPVTIGVQGGWGSGKTSLILVLEKLLYDDEQHRTLTVSVNAWEHSLFHESDDRANVAISLLSGMANGIDDCLHKVSFEKEGGWLENVDEIINKDNGIINKVLQTFPWVKV